LYLVLNTKDKAYLIFISVEVNFTPVKTNCTCRSQGDLNVLS